MGTDLHRAACKAASKASTLPAIISLCQWPVSKSNFKDQSQQSSKGESLIKVSFNNAKYKIKERKC